MQQDADVPPQAQKIALIDTANLFKVKSHNITVNQNGIPCGGIVGVGHAIEVLRDQGYYVVACLEGKHSTRRRRLLDPRYKTGRGRVSANAVDEANDSVSEGERQWQWQATINLLMIMRVPIVYSTGKEADDIIAYLTHLSFAADDNAEIRIVSNDSDFYQLLAPHRNLTMAAPTQVPSAVTFEQVKEKVGYDPRNTIWFKMLAGDKADSVRGIPRVGESTAKKLLTAHGSEPIASLQSLLKLIQAEDHKTMEKIEEFEANGGNLSKLYRVFSLELFDVVEGMEIKVVLTNARATARDVVQWFRKYHISLRPSAHHYATTLNDFHEQFISVFPNLSNSIFEHIATPQEHG
jgi:5'-3' exonuclease